MDNRALKGSRHHTFDVYAETIIYRGYPVRRGFALLMESEISSNVDRLIDVGNEPVTDEVPLPDDHAYENIADDQIELKQMHLSLFNPLWGPFEPPGPSDPAF